MARYRILVCFLLLVGGCSANAPRSIYPRHIETPAFPPIARSAHIIGKIWLTVTVDDNGNVTSVEARAENPLQREHPLLQNYAIENMRHWKFMKPPSGVSRQVILYDYEFDPSLPGEGGPNSLPPITKVNFDLPDQVTILTNLRFVDAAATGGKG